MKLWRVTAWFFGFTLGVSQWTACSGAKMSGHTGTVTHQSGGTDSATQADGGDPDGFHLKPIADMRVNGGDMPFYAETLRFALAAAGGHGDVRFTLEKDGEPDDTIVKDGVFSWTPGKTPAGGGFDPEVGQHRFTVNAQDETGAKARREFSVEVARLSVNALAKQGNLIRYEINESLHPDRRYEVATERDGMQLASATCVSMFDGVTTLTLEQSPLPVSKGMVKGDGGQAHSFEFEFRLSDADKARLGHVVFNMPIGFLPVPAEVRDSTATAPELVANYVDRDCDAAIREASLPVDAQDPDSCGRAVAQVVEPQNVYYCSEYLINQAAKAEMLKGFLCSILGDYQPEKFGCP